jgi:hypothetical protein
MSLIWCCQYALWKSYDADNTVVYFDQVDSGRVEDFQLEKDVFHR